MTTANAKRPTEQQTRWADWKRRKDGSMYTVSIATGLPCVQSDGELDDDFERGDESELVGGDWRDDPGPQIEVVGGDVDEANAREEQLADATREESEILCT